MRGPRAPRRPPVRYAYSKSRVELALLEAFREARPVPAFALVFPLGDHSCSGDLAYARCPSCKRIAGPSTCAPLLVPDY
jgi:hypothetical protein